MINIKKLIAFRAVLESSSITGAADKIGLTQSGVSRLITSLEQELDFPLFNRIKGRVQITSRGENFYRYNGFDRKISLGWTVVAQSKDELIPMYQKLNYLASLMAPDYTQGGFMRGNLVKLTVGDYITDVPGILTGIDFKIDESGGWNIGRDEFGNKIDGDYVMPKLIEVGGFKFLPIHDFIPKTVQQSFIETGDGVNNDAPFITYGKKGINPGGYLFQPDKDTNSAYQQKLANQLKRYEEETKKTASAVRTSLANGDNLGAGTPINL